MEQSKWIKVEDRLPELYQTVNICYYPKYLKGKGLVIPAIFEEGKFMDMKSEWFLNLDQKEIKLWQPLPQPPKED